jgi:hypothetical protein
MSTTRRRVNLTLTEIEERFLDAIMKAGSAEQDAVLRYLEWQAMGRGVPPGSSLGVADVVHVLLSMGMDQLENELAEISYAAEAAAEDPQDRAVAAALRRRFAASVLEDE